MPYERRSRRMLPPKRCGIFCVKFSSLEEPYASHTHKLFLNELKAQHGEQIHGLVLSEN